MPESLQSEAPSDCFARFFPSLSSFQKKERASKKAYSLSFWQPTKENTNNLHCQRLMSSKAFPFFIGFQPSVPARTSSIVYPSKLCN